MATITLRSVKGSPLTNDEVDANFNNLNVELGTKLAASSYNAADILTKLKTVDGSGSGLDADSLRGQKFYSVTPGAFVVSRVLRESNTSTATTALAHGYSVGDTVNVFIDRGEYHCKADVTSRARPGVVNGLGIWWRKMGLNGTNVNEVTSQLLTDLGRAPVFYDCQVEVALLQKA